MRLGMILVAILLPCLAQGAGEELIRLAPERVARMGIAVQSLDRTMGAGESALRLPALVTIPPAQVEVVTAPLPALVAQVAVASGETVRKGQLLARLHGAAFVETQRAYLEAQTRAALARGARERDEALFAEGIISQARLAASRATEREAAAQLEEKRQTLRLAGLSLPEGADKIHDAILLRAPGDGIVLETSVQPGQRVDAQTMLFKLGRLSPLWLEIQASTAQAATIRVGDLVRLPGCEEMARVRLITPQLQLASQAVSIRAELTNSTGCVKPYQFIQIEVEKRAQSGSILVPVTALVRHQGRNWLFVASEGGFRPQSVEVLEETPDAIRIKANLPAHARIAVKGVATIKAVWLGLGASEE